MPRDGAAYDANATGTLNSAGDAASSAMRPNTHRRLHRGARQSPPPAQCNSSIELSLAHITCVPLWPLSHCFAWHTETALSGRPRICAARVPGLRITSGRFSPTTTSGAMTHDDKKREPSPIGRVPRASRVSPICHSESLNPASRVATIRSQQLTCLMWLCKPPNIMAVGPSPRRSHLITSWLQPKKYDNVLQLTPPH